MSGDVDDDLIKARHEHSSIRQPGCERSEHLDNSMLVTFAWRISRQTFVRLPSDRAASQYQSPVRRDVPESAPRTDPGRHQGRSLSPASNRDGRWASLQIDADEFS